MIERDPDGRMTRQETHTSVVLAYLLWAIPRVVADRIECLTSDDCRFFDLPLSERGRAATVYSIVWFGFALSYGIEVEEPA